MMTIVTALPWRYHGSLHVNIVFIEQKPLSVSEARKLELYLKTKIVYAQNINQSYKILSNLHKLLVQKECT